MRSFSRVALAAPTMSLFWRLIDVGALGLAEEFCWLMLSCLASVTRLLSSNLFSTVEFFPLEFIVFLLISGRCFPLFAELLRLK